MSEMTATGVATPGIIVSFGYRQLVGQGYAWARRIYFAIQSAYIGADDERTRGLATARQLIDEFRAATTSARAREILHEALEAATADDCYRALKLMRHIIRHEDAVIGRSRPDGAINPDT